MPTFDALNHYFSGQGVVMIGTRDAAGNPAGLRPLGNVPDMKISVATTVVEHKGSQDGQRATDARLQTETKVSMTVTIENWIAANLAKALRGGSTLTPAGTVTAEAVNGYPGLVSALKFIKASSVVVHLGGTTLVAYTDGVTPWDYKLNTEAGSLMLNDGSVSGAAPTALGPVPTAVTAGATTGITVTVPAGAAVGQQVYLYGFTGADAAFINGKTATILTVTGTTAVTVNLNTTGKTITVAAGTHIVFLGIANAITVDYAYDAQYLVDSLTQPLNDSWLRFEGLNTVESNAPVIVDVFRFSNDPLKELALLSDTFGQFILEGSVLKDDTRLTGSKYFSIKKIN